MFFKSVLILSFNLSLRQTSVVSCFGFLSPSQQETFFSPPRRRCKVDVTSPFAVSKCLPCPAALFPSVAFFACQLHGLALGVRVKEQVFTKHLRRTLLTERPAQILKKKKKKRKCGAQWQENICPVEAEGTKPESCGVFHSDLPGWCF